ncbi:hypothetical protein BC938DRAFT_481581, partial [Jimgerdemannia flammicorona]
MGIFRRRVIFEEFMQRDEEYHALKIKYRPINEILGTSSDEKQEASANSLANTSENLRKDVVDPNRLSLTREHVIPIGPGLINRKNTCYVNSVLQCLTYTPPLANVLMSGEHGKSCKWTVFDSLHRQITLGIGVPQCFRKNFLSYFFIPRPPGATLDLTGTSPNTCMMCELERHVVRIFSGKSDAAFYPDNIVRKLNRVASHFQVRKQEDAHEFMLHILDAAAKGAKSGFSQMEYRDVELDVIHQIVGGTLRSQVKCIECRRESIKFDIILDVSLDVANVGSVVEALTDECLGMVDARKQMTIHHAPMVLTVHLKRFQFGGYSQVGMGGEKIDKYIEFPETLDLQEHFSPGQESDIGLSGYMRCSYMWAHHAPPATTIVLSRVATAN